MSPATLAPPPARAARRRAPALRPMLLLRRAHLFSGLFLAPWVLLYGATAFVFNHHAAFADARERELSAAERARLLPAGAPDAAALADALLAALRERAPELERCDPSPRLLGRFVFQGNGASERHTLTLEPDGSRGAWRAGPAAPEPEPPAFLAGLDAAALEGWVPRAEAQALLSELAAADVRPRLRDAPRLAFGVREGERRWVVEHDPADGALRARPAEEAGASDPLDLFLHLHTTHGRTGKSGAPRAWSWVVDAMALAMVGWALSGLAMWWQAPRLRRAGALVLVVCAALATWLGVGMAGALA